MAVQFDLPDFHQERAVTDDPIVSVNGPVNVTPFDSGVLDVGVFTQIHIAAAARGNLSVFQVTLTLYPTASTSFPVYVDTIYLVGNNIWYGADYSLVTRYCRVQVVELGSFGDSVTVQVSPSSGPARAIGLLPAIPVIPFTSVGPGATINYSPGVARRGLWRLVCQSRTPQWQLIILATTSQNPFTFFLTFDYRFVNLPLDTIVRVPSTVIQVQFSNLWAFAARATLFIEPFQE